MYTVLLITDIPACGKNLKYHVEICVDTESDLPNAKDSWAAGSMALVADTHEIKILNHNGEWI